MKRWTLRILLCLILGAVTTVAVACVHEEVSAAQVRRVLAQTTANHRSAPATSQETSSERLDLSDAVGFGKPASALNSRFVFGPADASFQWDINWPGFVIDTLFYAAIWFGVFFGFASAKRAIRRARGRCPMCGYDLRGTLNKGCSECGWSRQDCADASS